MASYDEEENEENKLINEGMKAAFLSTGNRRRESWR